MKLFLWSFLTDGFSRFLKGCNVAVTTGCCPTVEEIKHCIDDTGEVEDTVRWTRECSKELFQSGFDYSGFT